MRLIFFFYAKHGEKENFWRIYTKHFLHSSLIQMLYTHFNGFGWNRKLGSMHLPSFCGSSGYLVREEPKHC